MVLNMKDGNPVFKKLNEKKSVLNFNFGEDDAF